MFNVRELRKATDAAKAKAQAKVDEIKRQEFLAELEKQAKEEAQRRIDRQKADVIMQQLVHRCAIEAEAGRNHAILMSLHQGRDYVLPQYDYGAPTPGSLVHVARFVYDDIQAANAVADADDRLTVKFEYWHDGVGQDCGYNLVVAW